MKPTNTSKYAILGLVGIEPMSGYDIKKLVDLALSHFWNVSYGRLYPTLKELESEGLIVSRTEKQRGKPDRIVYSITDEGRSVLAEWLQEPAGRPRVRNEALLKIFLGYNVPAEANIAQLEAHRRVNEKLLDKYAQYKNMAEEGWTDPLQYTYSLLTIRNGEIMAEARIKWCGEAIAAIRAAQKQTEEK